MQGGDRVDFVAVVDQVIALLRQIPASISIHRTMGQARDASDPFVVADDHSVWHLQHHGQPRAIVAVGR